MLESACDSGELRLNESCREGWYNDRFGDAAPGTPKVIAVRFRYGEEDVRQVVSLKRDMEKASLVITPARCEPRPTRLSLEATVEHDRGQTVLKADVPVTASGA